MSIKWVGSLALIAAVNILFYLLTDISFIIFKYHKFESYEQDKNFYQNKEKTLASTSPISIPPS